MTEMACDTSKHTSYSKCTPHPLATPFPTANRGCLLEWAWAGSS